MTQRPDTHDLGTGLRACAPEFREGRTGGDDIVEQNHMRTRELPLPSASELECADEILRTFRRAEATLIGTAGSHGERLHGGEVAGLGEKPDGMEPAFPVCLRSAGWRDDHVGIPELGVGLCKEANGGRECSGAVQ